MSPFQGWGLRRWPTQGLRPDGRYTLGYSVSPSGLGAGNLFGLQQHNPLHCLIRCLMELDISSSYFNSLSRPKGPNSSAGQDARPARYMNM